MTLQPQDIQIADFFYDLPDASIARHPLAKRDSCRLICADKDGIIAESLFDALPSLLRQDTLLVCNNTRVINARVRMQRSTGANIEIFCLEPLVPADYERNFASSGPVEWQCLVGNAKRWKDGETLTKELSIDGKCVTLSATKGTAGGDNRSVVFSWDDDSLSFARVISAAGVIPIPPYLNRDTEESDTEDYQTLFSRINGSVAAPTAGLHFTPEVMDEIASRGIPVREVTLHVGAGTFQPVKSDTIGEHPMHAELIAVPRSFIAEMATNTRPITAVGTTTVRTLESLYHIGCLMAQGQWQGEVPQWYAYSADHPQLTVAESMQHILSALDAAGDTHLTAATRIIIAPGYRFRMVRDMVTNFHQPGSTLLLLVSALIGNTWRSLYTHAVNTGYRFLSYGDACLLRSQ